MMRKLLVLFSLALFATTAWAQSSSSGSGSSASSGSGRASLCGGIGAFCARTSVELEQISAYPLISTGPNSVSANVPPFPSINTWHIDPIFGNRYLIGEDSTVSICGKPIQGVATYSSVEQQEISPLDPGSGTYTFLLTGQSSGSGFWYKFSPSSGMTLVHCGGPGDPWGGVADGQVAFDPSTPRQFYVAATPGTGSPQLVDQIWKVDWPSGQDVGNGSTGLNTTVIATWNPNDVNDLNGKLNASPNFSLPSAPTLAVASGGSLASAIEFVTVSLCDSTVGTCGSDTGPQYMHTSNQSNVTTSGTCPGSGNCSITVQPPGGASTTCGLSTTDTIKWSAYVGQGSSLNFMQQGGWQACGGSALTVSSIAAGPMYNGSCGANGCQTKNLTASATTSPGQRIAVAIGSGQDQYYIQGVFDTYYGWRFYNTITQQVTNGGVDGSGTACGSGGHCWTASTGAVTYSTALPATCSGYLMHQVTISRAGNYTVAGPQSGCSSWGISSNTIKTFWAIDTLNVYVCGTTVGNDCAGHAVAGDGVYVNDEGNSHELQFLSRPQNNPTSTTAITPNASFLAGFNRVDDHSSWNAWQTNCTPVVSFNNINAESGTHQPLDQQPWEEEVLGIDPCNIQTVYRFGRMLWNVAYEGGTVHDPCGATSNFPTNELGALFPDFKYALVTTDWGGGGLSGSNPPMLGCYATTLSITDVGVVELR